MYLSVPLYNLVFAMSSNVYHLRKSEVAYELKIRGLPVEGTANELRKRLSQCLAINTPTDKQIVNELDTKTELKECKDKYLVLESLMADYEEGKKDEYNRLVARGWHLYYRIERIPVAASLDEEPEKRKSELLQRTKSLLETFIRDKPEEESKSIEESSSDSEQMTEEQKESDHRPPVGNLTSTNTSSPRPPALHTRPPLHNEERPRSQSPAQYARGKSIPVYKWGLKFDNEPGQSVGSFLERVEELRRARGVSEQELFESAVDLFAGTALIWYRSTTNRIKTWADLCLEMKTVFQSPDYDYMLLQEIMNRTQGDNEPIDMYLAAMGGLYGRMAEKVPEGMKLQQILKNLNPYLQEKLCMFNIRDTEELREMGRKAELGRLRSSYQCSTARNVKTLEPDLAYHSGGQRTRALGKTYEFRSKVSALHQQRGLEKRPTAIKCWNCSMEGHKFSQCRKEREILLRLWKS